MDNRKQIDQRYWGKVSLFYVLITLFLMWVWVGAGSIAYGIGRLAIPAFFLFLFNAINERWIRFPLLFITTAFFVIAFSGSS